MNDNSFTPGISPTRSRHTAATSAACIGRSSVIGISVQAMAPVSLVVNEPMWEIIGSRSGFSTMYSSFKSSMDFSILSKAAFRTAGAVPLSISSSMRMKSPGTSGNRTTRTSPLLIRPIVTINTAVNNATTMPRLSITFSRAGR